MCGIVAFFSKSPSLTPDVVERATKRLSHRGPDGQRQWISADRRVALGHARLSIIDLATGDQPIASEDALHLYEDLGTQCLHQLRGEFAFVLWDEHHRRMFAARDRFGIKPLFYAMHGDTLCFASEAKALFAAGVPARWDAESVYHAVEFGGHPVRTLFDGILQVPPGHYLIATEKHVQL